MAITIGQSGAGTVGWGGKVVATLFFGVFAAIGTLFFFLLGAMAWRTVTTFAWDETACIIDESRMEEADVESAGGWQVKYHYTVAGQEYVSTQLSRGGFSRDDSSDLRDSQRYVAGEPATCYVNPEHPDEAVLVRASLWSALWGLFPLPFMAIGYGGMFFTWRKKRPAAVTAASGFTAAARSRTGMGGTVFVLLFFGGFFVIGTLLTWVIGVKPVLRVLDAKNWNEVPCTIVSSSVEDHSSDDSTTYSVRVVYRYEVGGRTYTTDRYKFMGGSSSGRAGKEAVVRDNPPGSERHCYVNPADPTDAVIERGFTGDIAFGFIPLVFTLVGAGGLVGFMVRRARGPRASRFPHESNRFRPGTGSSIAGGGISPGREGAGPTVLEVKGSRAGKFIGFVIFSLIWNGIVSIFVVNLVGDWSRSGPEWFMSIFLLPFIAVGLFMIGMSVHAALAMFNPRPRLQVSSAALPPGGTLEVHWEMAGNTQRVQRFQVVLEGREEATYRRGTNTHTDKSTFARLDIADVRDPATIVAGSARLQLPDETMHSFASRNNKIVWTLRVRGDIPHWPDIDDEFPFTVLAAGLNPFLAS